MLNVPIKVELLESKFSFELWEGMNEWEFYSNKEA